MVYMCACGSERMNDLPSVYLLPKWPQSWAGPDQETRRQELVPGQPKMEQPRLELVSIWDAVVVGRGLMSCATAPPKGQNFKNFFSTVFPMDPYWHSR